MLAPGTQPAGSPISSRCPTTFATGTLPTCAAWRLRARAAYGPKDSIRDALSSDVTEPFLVAIDRLLKVLAKREVQ